MLSRGGNQEGGEPTTREKRGRGLDLGFDTTKGLSEINN